MQTVFQRLFSCLDGLIPNLSTLSEGDSLYAPPRIAGDMAVHLAVSAVALPVIELEIAHDEVKGNEERPAPWIVIRVDVTAKTAEILAIQDQWRYEVAFSQEDKPNPQRTSMNLYAVNWLTLMEHLGTVFHPTATNLVQKV